MLVALLAMIPVDHVSAQSDAADGVRLLFREDWKTTPAELPITQEHVASKDLVLVLHGPGKQALKKSHHDKPADDPYYLWSGQCKERWAFTLRPKLAMDLSAPAARLRVRTKQSGGRQLCVIIKSAGQPWSISKQSIPTSQDWQEFELHFAELDWTQFDPHSIDRGDDQATVSLDAVEEIGLTDLQPGGGSPASSRVDWIALWGDSRIPTAAAEETETRDDVSDAIVKRTELWPAKIDVPAGVEAKELVYARRPEMDLDLTYFTQTDRGGKRPAILFVHGGSWRHGDKRQFYRQAAYLTHKYDLFSVCITYRLSGVAKYPAALSDCKTAVRWIRSVADEHRIDTNRIAICGGSAGAHLSSLVALTNGVKKFDAEGPYSDHSSDVHLAILYNGHFDLTEQLKEHIQDRAMLEFFGYHPWQRPDIYGEASPILWVNADSPPMLFLHGDQDHFPHKQSIAMTERLKDNGVAAEVEIYPGKGHAWFNREPDLEITTKRIAKFLEKHFIKTPER